MIVNPAHAFGPGDPGRSSHDAGAPVHAPSDPAYVEGTLNVVGVQDVARGHLLADERGTVGERYHFQQSEFHHGPLFADLGRLSRVEPPALKLPLPVALAAGGQRVGGIAVPTPVEARTASLNWAFVNRKAKRELGWKTSPHEDCLEETVAWYRGRDGVRVSRPGARQPVPLRLVGGALRRVGRL